MNNLLKSIRRFILVFILILLWEIIPRLFPSIIPFFPPFSKVIMSFFTLIISVTFLNDFGISMLRIFLGFGLAILIGIPMGFILGSWRKIEELIEPIFEFLRPLSPIALFPLFLLFFGIGLKSQVAIIFWVSIFPLVVNVTRGVKSVDKEYLTAIDLMGANIFQRFRYVIIPHSMHWLITGLRLSFAGSLLALIASEMIGSSAGLGYRILYFSQTFKIPEMYAAIIFIGIIGFLSNYLFTKLERKIIIWQE